MDKIQGVQSDSHSLPRNEIVCSKASLSQESGTDFHCSIDIQASGSIAWQLCMNYLINEQVDDTSSQLAFRENIFI